SIEEIVNAALARANKVISHHRIQVAIAPELPVVRVDPRAVSEVVYSLVENAAKYSPAETLIRITASRPDDETVEFAVEDLGGGIPTELRGRVFDKFFRATREGDANRSLPPGSGMGLAIAKGIVEAHSGRIWIESGPGGRGTRVVFALPI